MKHTKWMLSVLFVTVLSCFVSAGVYASAAESATITSGCISAIFSVTISSSASVKDTRNSTAKAWSFPTRSAFSLSSISKSYPSQEMKTAPAFSSTPLVQYDLYNLSYLRCISMSIKKASCRNFCYGTRP